MKVKIEIPEIHCYKRTKDWWFTGGDAIFAAVLVVGTKVQDGKLIPITPLGQVTNIRSKVKKGESWTPTPHNFLFDVQDAENIAVFYALYEVDNFKIYDQLKAGFADFANPDVFDWMELWEKVKETVLQGINERDGLTLETIQELFQKFPQTAPQTVFNLIFNFAKTVFKHFRQDDLIDQDGDLFSIEQVNLNYQKEYEFTGHGGYYAIETKVELLA